MASPGQLVEVTAAALGLSEATVRQYDRVLAESGLRSKSGRGSSAAKVTAEDTANLLIAIAASPLSGAPLRDAATRCKIYGSLPSTRVRGSMRSFGSCGLRSLSRLKAKHTFSDALQTLLSGAS